MVLIPVLGIPAVNRRDLLDALLVSIDEPIGRLIIIDNSLDGSMTRGLEAPNLVALAPHHNLGVSASWNLIIKATPRAKWWAIINSDIAFAPGDLANLANHMATSPGVGMLLGLAAFAVSAEAIGKVGWFDEAFVPAYCEDNDFTWRCHLAGVPMVDVPSNLTHVGSAVIRSDPVLGAQNVRTYTQNVAYYEAKWGGRMGQEVYTTPFNRGGDPADWHLDLARLADQTWR